MKTLGNKSRDWKGEPQANLANSPLRVRRIPEIQGRERRLKKVHPYPPLVKGGIPMNPSLRLKGREEALIKTYEQPAWLKNKATQDTGGEKQINPPAGQKANSI